MSLFRLVPRWFNKVNKRYATPTRTIIVFSGVAIVQTMIAFLTPGGTGASDNAAIELLTDLYAFGATTGYLIVFVSLITLRFKDPYTPRPYRMPLNIPIKVNGRRVDFPVLGVLGMIGVAITLFEVVLTHPLGRIAGRYLDGLAFDNYSDKTIAERERTLAHLALDYAHRQPDEITTEDLREFLNHWKDASVNYRRTLV